MRILIVTQDFPPETGGIQAFIYEMAKHFLARGHAVTVVCPGAKNTPSPLPPQGRVIRIPIHSSWLFLPLLFRLPRILRAGNFDRVVYAQWPAVLSGLFIPSKSRPPSLCMAYGREMLSGVFGPLRNLLCRYGFETVDTVAPISRAVEKLLRLRANPKKTVLVPPGVDPHRFVPSNAQPLRDRYGFDDGPVILSMARMVHRKGLDLVLKAFVRIRTRFPKAWLILAGDGPEAPALKALAFKMGVAERVRFPGIISAEEMPPLYSLASVFVLPSRESPKDIEGFGIVYLEAGACEVPVIGTRTGGIPDAVLEGVTGLLVPQEDESALAGALDRLLGNPEEARRMGLAARERILRELTWEATGDRILDILK